MALINCPECGKEISERAKSCPNCGCPIEAAQEQTSEKTDSNYVTIHGYEETFAVDTNVKIYKNGELAGEVAPASKFKLPIDGDCELTFKASIRSAKVIIRKGIDTNVFLSFDRFSGKLKAYVSDDANRESVIKVKEHNSSKALLNSILLIALCIAAYLIFKFVIQ